MIKTQTNSQRYNTGETVLICVIGILQDRQGVREMLRKISNVSIVMGLEMKYRT